MKKKECYQKVTAPMRERSGIEKARESYAHFKDASILRPSSSVILSADIKPGEMFTVHIDKENKMMKLSRCRVESDGGVDSRELLRASKMGGVGIGGHARVYFRCNALCSMVGIREGSFRVPVVPLGNGFELNYSTATRGGDSD